jgi:type IX secretion system PorP/SprF family membrane protein
MKFLISLLLLSQVILSRGQQIPLFSYFTYNYINYNPAVTGYTPCFEARAGYRQQWLGFSGAPRSGFALAHGKFGEKKRNFHGLGGYVETDNAGPFNFTSMNLNYAYHLRVSKGYTLASGISVGFSQYRIDFGSMALEQQDIDPVISGSVSDFVFPQINLGFWLYKEDRFYGLSVRQLKHNDIGDLQPKTLRRHLTLTYGRAFPVSDELTFKPAGLLNYVGKSKASLDAQAILDFRHRVALGLGVRGGHGITALLKLDVIKYLTVAYAYDLTLSKLRNAGSSSHELTIGMRACSEKSKYHVPCAAYD